MSYKGAWDAIDAMNNLAGEPLVLRAAGGRAAARAADRPARRLIATFRALEAEHRKFMENLTRAGLDASGDIDLEALHAQDLRAQPPAGHRHRHHAGRGQRRNPPAHRRRQTLTATITRESTQELGLADGKEAIALIKASSVIVGVPGRACACRPATSCRAPSRPCAPAR